MKYKIIGDSCFDVDENIRELVDPVIVPLTIQVQGRELVDDSSLDTNELIKLMKESPASPKTASPSPAQYMKAYEGADEVFAVTLSSRLSGSYSSAVLAQNMALEQDKDRKIHVFDSKSATIAQTLIGIKLSELSRQDLEFTDIVEKTEEYIQSLKTFFILESLDNLTKAGRISKLAGLIGSVLSIRPIMGATDEGTIYLVEKVRGSKSAFKRLVDIIGENCADTQDRILGISHVNCLERAKSLKAQIQERFNFKDIVIVEGRGITTVYAGEGGIVLAF